MRKVNLGPREIRIWGVIVLGIAFTAGTCLAAEPAPDKPAAENAKPQPAARAARQVGLERKLVFTDGEDLWPMQYDPDVELPRHRYVARFTLNFWHPRYDRRLPTDVVGERVLGLEIVPEFAGLFLDLRGMRISGPPEQYLLDWLPRLVENMPEASRLSEDMVAELRSRHDPLVATTTVTASGHGSRSNHAGSYSAFTVFVCAAEKERVKELAKAIVLAIDLGFSPQCHLDFTARAQGLEAFIEDLDAKAARFRREIDALEKERQSLSSYDDLNSEAMASLVAHRRMIDVDLAGIEARLKACQKIIVATQRNSTMDEQRRQVETVKITAEIELAGLAAKRAAIDELIANGNRRFELNSKTNKNVEELDQLKVTLGSATRTLGEYHAAVEQRWAYPEVDSVMVLKIRWEPKMRKGEGFM